MKKPMKKTMKKTSVNPTITDNAQIEKITKEVERAVYSLRKSLRLIGDYSEHRRLRPLESYLKHAVSMSLTEILPVWGKWTETITANTPPLHGGEDFVFDSCRSNRQGKSV